MANLEPHLNRTIRTPDQRLRVFISSTLQELAEERRAAKLAVEHLRLAPVMFELGARPHPPRDLYRAYLEQSDVFVGVYWQRYGWVAPGETVSGLEDEYNLSGNRPKLIYVKRPAPEREPRLNELLRRVQDDDRAAYKPFDTAEELRELLENDLALLLTESFEMSRLSSGPAAHSTPSADATSVVSLPAPQTSLVGRQQQIEEVSQLLRRREVRLVTLLGPGGIGKTRLALAVAEHLRESFTNGVAFVPLASVREAGRVFEAAVEKLNLKLEGSSSALSVLTTYLQDKDVLLVLDNFEQVINAAPGVAELLSVARDLQVLVTSRSLLNLSAEHVYPVPPLALPEGAAVGGEAVELFLERSRALRSSFTTGEQDLLAVAEIVRRLDGLPLAIELAAARTKLLSPQHLLRRLGRRLDLLTSGARDLPDRQKTLRGTIDWSFSLLEPHEQRLFIRLGVFMGGASLSAIEAICGEEAAEEDLLDTLADLVGHSLVQALPSESEPRFGMLETLREYALEKLEQGVAGDPEVLRERHMQTYLELAERVGPQLKLQQRSQLPVLVAEHANLRLAIEWCLKREYYTEVVRFGWALWLYWWILNHQATALPWMEEVLKKADLSDLESVRAQTVTGALYIRRGEAEDAYVLTQEGLARIRAVGDPATEALVHNCYGFSLLVLQDYERSKEAFLVGLELFRALGDRWGVAFVHVALARIALGQGDAEGAIAFTEPLTQTLRAAGDENTTAWMLHVLGLAKLSLAKFEQAAHHLGESLELFSNLGNLAGSAHVIESIAGLALARGDAARAVRLGGAAQALSEAVGALPFQPERSIFERNFATARTRVGEAYQMLELEGRKMAYVEALSYARESLAVAAQATG